MNKQKALLYLRSQNDEPFTIFQQEEELLAYCKQHNIEVVNTFTDTCSGKDFDRRGFRKLLDFVGNNRNGCNLVLFRTWDRFSRNRGKGYYMVRHLLKHGIEAKPMLPVGEDFLSIPDVLAETEMFSATYHVYKDDMVVFANILYQARLENRIARHDGDQIVVGVTYNVKDEIHLVYIDILDEVEKGGYDPEKIIHAIQDIGEVWVSHTNESIVL